MLSIPPTAPRRARHLLPAGRASFVAGERPIVAFRESETGRLFEVPQRSGVFALGRARDSALWLPRVGVAWKEWELWWNRTELWVEDQTGEWRTRRVIPAPGQILRAGTVSLRALSQRMRDAEAALVAQVGCGAHAIDAILCALATATTIVVLGGHDGAPRQLLHALDLAMPMPHMVDIARTAPRRSVCIDLRSDPNVTPQSLDPLRDKIRAGRNGLRVLATSRDEVERRLGRIPRGVPVVEVPHLRDRRMEIPRLFAEAMARREWPTQLADLGVENARTMMEREWPGNGDDIENVAAQVAHLLQNPSDQALRRELAEIGLTFPARTAERRERPARPRAANGTR